MIKVDNDMEYPVSTLKKIVSIVILTSLLIGCQTANIKPNQLASFLEGAELQIETADQRHELKRALEDILKLSPEQLQKQRYANYRMEVGVWTLPKILSAYFLPNRPMMIDSGNFYSEVAAESVKSIVNKKLKQLKSIDT